MAQGEPLSKLDIRRVKIGKSVRYNVRDLQAFADLHGDRPPVRQGKQALGETD